MKRPVPSYQFARDLIARLRQNAWLGPMTIPDIFSAGEQCQAIAMAAAQTCAAIAVSVGNPVPLTVDGHPQILRFNLPVLVGIYARKELGQSADYDSLDEYLHAVAAEIIEWISPWPDQFDVPYTGMWINGIDDIDLSKLADLKTLTGKGIIIMTPVNYQPKYTN